MTHIAARLSVVKPSASMAVSQAAKDLAATGVDVCNLGLGEPDFQAPGNVTEAAFDAARADRMLYTAALGTPDCRKSIAAKFKRENGLDFALDEIAVANGAKQIIFNALMATVEEGDELILPAPYFVSYPEMAKLFGGVPVTPACRAETGFHLTPEALEAAITPKTRWLFLNLPNNPSGASYTRDQLAILGAVLEKHPQVMILSDEIYEHILFDGREFVSFGAACPQLRDRSLIVNGVSKAYAMTGWRVGYAGGPRDLIKAMATIQSQSCTSVCTPAQIATRAALDGPQDCVAEFREAFERRRDLVMDRIRHINGLTLDPPEGAFYAYIGCAALIGATTPAGQLLETDIDVTQYLLSEGHVAAVPGAAYGLSPFFRISTATSDEELSRAMDRIAEAVSKLNY
ncbi:pyridoxal phosphate-dependent aminotransferase [Phaeobacter gallaeciensis]|uniref:pyridoxal phosphate-dependent aminotransferase n=1 Tax=Phaeobacter gallaeciensis TaxID=60890 RepID=UPI00237FAE52|nr:pyridoxal phosphate-dependent aminotransferase [Phaeobacter gallaeciensis]MDE4063166.1 pyridoxal phosphate-dependent aminotransferase [Phaeobacter gallaeciensis]MDE4126196.1 pyridoxal phosphate-dependent aminotransferase [Phaeobacter gallaeciensis]MDE4130662.1 pyridoxal phosphate-dependent aminotransferase [Phaeobacter gallaeciensis]